MKVYYPAHIMKAGDKTAFLYRLKELLRLDHNEHGKDYRENKITKAQWEKYLETWNIKFDAVITDLLAERKKLVEDETENIIIDEVVY